MDYSDVRWKMYARLQGLASSREGHHLAKTAKKKTKNSRTGPENKISANMPPHGGSRSLHSTLWNTKCENPLTGMEPGTSLKVYSFLLARGFWPSSSHTEWEEERRFTKDRKDCRDRESDFL